MQTEAQMIAFQEEASKKIITSDAIDISAVKYVGGVDISFEKGTDKACGYLTVVEYDTNKIVYEDHEVVTLDMPYISGLLGFREIPVYKILLDRIRKNKPELYPAVVLLDGFGTLHHRKFGVASHLGYDQNICTIGIGKTLLNLDGLNELEVKKEFKSKCKKAGDFLELVGKSGVVHGVAYKSTQDCNNPIYISVGHMISLASCVKIVGKLCQYRIPEPIRNSDIKSKLYL